MNFAIDPQQIWSEYSQAVIDGAINVLGAGAILIFGIWIANWSGGAMRKFSRKHPGIDDTLAALFAWLVRYALIGFVIVAVLNRFGVATTSIVAVLGASALAIGLALQGTLSNLAAGVMLMLFRPYRLGDLVELSGQTGTVEDVTLFTTELATPQNVKVVLPNALCWGAAMINFTGHPRRRVDLDFAVAYDSNLDDAVAVLEKVAAEEKRILEEPKPRVEVTRLGDFSITLSLRAWVNSREYLPARFALTRAGKEALDANGIAIPFPTTTSYTAPMPRNGAKPLGE